MGRKEQCALACSIACAALSGSCAEPHALDWQLSFSDASMEDDAVVVEARILEGSCASGNVVYESRFTMGESAPMPPPLTEGRYSFFARVRDSECRWYASGCVEKRLPLDGDGKIVLELEPNAAPALDCMDCNSASCMAAQDGGNTGDAGGAPFVAMTIRFEAEEAQTLLPPLATHADTNASGGEYVSYLYDATTMVEPIDTFKRSDPPAQDADGIASYPFTVDIAGDYRLWTRVITPILDEDSFWFKMDDGAWILWNDVAHVETWQWVDVRAFDQRSQMLVFPLSEGSHTLFVSYRELNAKLDVLLVTNDLSLIPSD